jgi:hypothetical protein
MSFIYTYYFAQNHLPKPITTWTEAELIRFEKLLRLENHYLGVQLTTNDKAQFLAAVQSKSELIRFLEMHPEFAQLFRQASDLLKDYEEVDYSSFSMPQLTAEVDQYLSSDWSVFCIETLENGQLYYFKFMLRFELLLPERIFQLLKNKIESRLLQFSSDLDTSDFKSDWQLFAEYERLVEQLKDQRLKQLVIGIQAKRRRLLNESIDIINKPGIVHFFETMFGGIYYLFHDSKDAEEQRHRKRVMGDFKFMSSILLGIVVLFILGAIWGNQQKATRQQQSEAAKVGFYPSFYFYKENQIELGARIADTLQSGYDFIQKKYKKPNSAPQYFINSTPFEVVLFSDFQAIQSFFTDPQKQREATQYLWIQPKDTLQFETYGLPFHMYVGKQLCTVQSAKNAQDQYPRFLNPFQGTEKYTALPIEMKGKYMELKGTNFELFLRADQPFFVDGQSKVNDTVFNLFKN